MADDFYQYLPSALKVAKKAGLGILECRQATPLQISTKPDASPLTNADLLAHEIIKVGLLEITPQLPVLSEEDCQIPFAERQEWSCYWLVDPLDGTREFIRGSEEFTVNIALIYHNQPVLGIIYLPVADISYFACRGQKAFKQQAQQAPEPICTQSRPPTRPLALVMGHYSKGKRLASLLDVIPYETSRLGSALKFCRIAEGQADLYPCLGAPYEWDTAAGQCIIEAAGGRVLDLSLQPLRYNLRESLVSPQFIAVGDPKLLKQLNLANFIQNLEKKT